MSMDLKPLLKTAIGFDRLVEMMDNMTETQTNYPPYDIERIEDGVYRISMAVAGFTQDELTVTLDKNVLIIRGQEIKETNQEHQHIIYQGIAKRSFEKRFSLARYIEITDAVLEDGLLNVILEEDVPEEDRPEEIEIR